MDSGATKNIVDETTWEWLKQHRIICASKVASRQKKLYPYASTTPLEVKGTFSTTVKIGAKETTAEFLVIKGKGTPLLGHDTATLLDVLRIGPVISAISSVEENLQQQCQDLISKARTEKDAKIQECEELRSQVFTPQKMEVLRMRLQSEIELPHRQRLETLETELQRSKSDFNKLRYDYSFLKAEYEHEHSQYQRIQEEMKSQYETQIVNLQRERDFLTKKQEELNDSQRVRTLQKENTQLNLKVKSLLNELEELREKREAAGLQSDHVSKLQARQLAESTAHCKELEADIETLKAQHQRLHTEKGKSDKQDQYISQVYELENGCNALKSEILDRNHKHKVEMTNVKMELTKNRGDLERERDSLKLECDSLRNKITVSENTVEYSNVVIGEKEQEACKREQAAKEKEWDKLNQMEKKQTHLEATIAELGTGPYLER